MPKATKFDTKLATIQLP